AEAALLRIYIHGADYRDTVLQALEDRDLQFSYSHHRALWRQLQQWQDTDAITDLAAQLRAIAAESTSPISQLQHLLVLDEKTRRDILRAPLVVRAASACIEKNLCEKRYRHFLQLWSESDGKNPDQQAYYQKLVYAEKHRIADLEKERQVSFEDLATMPWVGEFYDAID
ncbi:DNA primase, partial [filamentous cyanobacterium CCP5]